MAVINMGEIDTSEIKPGHVFVLAAIESAVYTECWDCSDSWEFPGGSARFSLTVNGRGYIVDVETEERPNADIRFVPQIRSVKALAGWS
jgi:hypothetical protein